MTHQLTADAAPSEIIYIIRHGEKPADPPLAGPGQSPPAPEPPFGVDEQGNQNPHSLLPRGWQRSGALTVLFDSAVGTPQARLRTPAALLSPSYGHPAKTAAHRTHQTIQGLSDRLGLQIVSSFAEGQGSELAASVVSGYPGVVLICWNMTTSRARLAAGRPGNGDTPDLAWRPVRCHLDVHTGAGSRPGPIHLQPDPPAAAIRR